MTEADERPDLREQVGSAVGFGVQSEGIAALGTQQLKRGVNGVPVTHNGKPSEQGGLPVEDLERRIGALLFRLKYGHELDCRRPAVQLLAQLLQQQSERRKWWIWPGRQFVCFVARAIDEWVHDGCPRCGGRGRDGVSLESTQHGRRQCERCEGLGYVDNWVHGGFCWFGNHDDFDGDVTSTVREPCADCQGHGSVPASIARTPSLGRVCPSCRGSGKSQVSEAVEVARARALGCGMAQYHQLWKRRFLQVSWLLGRIDAGVARGLHCELRRRTIAAK